MFREYDIITKNESSVLKYRIALHNNPTTVERAYS